MSDVPVVIHCTTCEYFMRIYLAPDKIGTHGCMTCNQPMDVYVPIEYSEVLK